MLPVASGSQVRGSIVRPASLCGVIGNKPTFGAVHPGGGFGGTPSAGHVGMLAGSLVDCWQVTHYIANTVGGAPGHPGLYGGPALPPPRRPRRLLRQYTIGWEKTDEASRAAFDAFLGRLGAAGVEIVEPRGDADCASYEKLTCEANQVLFDIMAWEGRWPLLYVVERRPQDHGPNVLGPMERTRKMTLEEYRVALGRREQLRAAHRALAGRVDGFITLAHIGPAQLGLPPVGTPWYNDASSVVGAPTYSLPLMAIEDVPLGVQLMGFEHGDQDLTAVASWMLETLGAAATVGDS